MQFEKASEIQSLDVGKILLSSCSFPLHLFSLALFLLPPPPPPSLSIYLPPSLFLSLPLPSSLNPLTNSLFEPDHAVVVVVLCIFPILGNDGSAFVEVLVARSSGLDEEKWEVLLVASSFMSPADSKSWTNPTRVRMFGEFPKCRERKDGELCEREVISEKT